MKLDDLRHLWCDVKIYCHLNMIQQYCTYHIGQEINSFLTSIWHVRFLWKIDHYNSFEAIWKAPHQKRAFHVKATFSNWIYVDSFRKKNAPITNIHLCLTNMMQNPLICWDIETWTAISRTIDHRNNEYFYNAMISVDFRMKFTKNKTENNNTFFRWEVSVLKKNWI